jgi:hypothetical protein
MSVDRMGIVPTLEERVTALEAIVRNTQLAGRERDNDVRRDIADLGSLTAKSFLGVHHQMDRIETRMTGMETRFSAMETRFTALECFRQKCEAVFRKQARQNKGLGSACDSIKTGQTLKCISMGSSVAVPASAPAMSDAAGR